MNSDLFNLQGRKALVLGACGNIGRRICKELTARQAEIVVADLNADGCISLAKELESICGGRYIPVFGDCSTEEGIQAVMDACETLMPLQIVIHCIGLISSSSVPGYAVAFEKQSLEAWETALKVNLTSAFLMAKHIYKILDQSGKASVIFLSSIYGSFGPDWAIYENTEMCNPLAYGASKGGLQQLMRYLASLWAPTVRVNCVSPGGIQLNQPKEFIKRYEQRTPMRRMATPEDVVGPVIFLASDAAQYITGQNILVDGGWSVL